jgi:hypothetical protein
LMELPANALDNALDEALGIAVTTP